MNNFLVVIYDYKTVRLVMLRIFKEHKLPSKFLIEIFGQRCPVFFLCSGIFLFG